MHLYVPLLYLTIYVHKCLLDNFYIRYLKYKFSCMFSHPFQTVELTEYCVECCQRDKRIKFEKLGSRRNIRRSSELSFKAKCIVTLCTFSFFKNGIIIHIIFLLSSIMIRFFHRNLFMDAKKIPIYSMSTEAL